MKKNARRVGNTLRPLVGRGWAWKIQDMSGGWHLCNWCEPSRERLERGKKPSPEAIAVYVKTTANAQPYRIPHPETGEEYGAGAGSARGADE